MSKKNPIWGSPSEVMRIHFGNPYLFISIIHVKNNKLL